MAGRWGLSISYLSAFNSLLNNALHACWQIWYIFRVDRVFTYPLLN